MAAIAPMEMPGPAANVIPLQCLICPKKPTFSDLSHLLTHIASKSHLSQKFKVGLRPDPESKADTAAYLDWEARYGINDLLAERLASKEKKTTGKKRARNFASASGPRDRPHDDDTALMMDGIKIEPDEILHAQAIYGWSSSSTRQGYFDNSGFQTPTTRRSRDSATLPSTPQQQHSMILRRRRFPSESTAVSGTTSELLSESTEMPEDTNEGDNATKLKGIVYEGMGLFDSATTPQKKKRNQRKDASVLVKMQQTSRDITSVETVYELTEEGLKRLRERDVYDSPSIDGSQDEAEPSKKKRARRTLTTATSRQARRSSARLTRKMTADPNDYHKTERLDEVDEDADGEIDDDVGPATHTHLPAETYDVFSDGPKPASQHSWMGGGWQMTNGPLVTTRHHSPMEDYGYDSRRSNALRSMSTNHPSEAVRTHSPFHFPTRDAGASAFTSQPSIPAAPFYHPHGLSNAGTYTGNPLCAQPRPIYYSAGYTGYTTADIKPQPGFQAVNMTQNLGNLGYGSYNQGQYSADQHDSVGQDFDL